LLLQWSIFSSQQQREIECQRFSSETARVQAALRLDFRLSQSAAKNISQENFLNRRDAFLRCNPNRWITSQPGSGVRRCSILFVLVCVGCRVSRPYPADPARTFPAPDAHVDLVAVSHLESEVRTCSAVIVEGIAPSLDLPSLWNIALTNNPSLREAAAGVEAARGRLIQATKYPNPSFTYEEEEIGSPGAPAGAIRLLVSQPIVTGRKRPLDISLADQALNINELAQIGRKFAVLTLVRRAYYDYIGLAASVRVSEEVVASLSRAVEITRKQVEQARTRPRSDLLRLEALLVGARTTLTTNRSNRDAAWRNLATEIGLPNLAMPSTVPPDLPAKSPALALEGITKTVLAVNTDLKQATADTERTRLQVERARAEVIPDVTVGGGYTRDFVDNAVGASISIQTPIPVWDRKQGLIVEAQANHARTIAFRQGTANRLTQETAAAFARYDALRQQVDQLSKEAIPRLRDSLDLLLKGYQAGAAQVTFADVFQAQQDLNASRLALTDAGRNLWLAIADLQGLMQVDVGEEDAMAQPHELPDPCGPLPSSLPAAVPPRVGAEPVLAR
jgi:cobalt-zinc-cadmium efflux system outer membrane protein